MRFLRKKRVFALVLLFFVGVLFYRTDWVGQWLYPVSYEAHILQEAQIHAVNPVLMAAVIRVESNFVPDRVSPKNAVGLMQIMPDTANWIIEMAGYNHASLENLDEPAVNIQLGAWYLQRLGQQFADHLQGRPREDQIAMIAAAYNAGPGSLSRWLSEGVWDGSYASREQIPYGETRHYVRRIVHYYEIYEDYYADSWKARSVEP